MFVVYELNGRRVNKEFADQAALEAWLTAQGSISSLAFTKGE